MTGPRLWIAVALVALSVALIPFPAVWLVDDSSRMQVPAPATIWQGEALMEHVALSTIWIRWSWCPSANPLRWCIKFRSQQAQGSLQTHWRPGDGWLIGSADLRVSGQELGLPENLSLACVLSHGARPGRWASCGERE